MLAVSQGHTAAIEKLVELKCDIAAKDEDGDNAMHLCIIKKANLVQDVQGSESPKIYEMFVSLASVVNENRLMYALLCFLAKEGCPLDVNFKGARVLDWIPSQQIKDIIVGYERARIAREKALAAIPPATDRSLNNSREEEEDPAMNHLQANMEAVSMTASNNLDESEGNNAAVFEGAASSPGTSGLNQPASNPPTPARRNRGHNREAATMGTPPPIPSHHPNVTAHEDESKRMNIEPTAAPSEVTVNATPLDSPARFQSPNRALSPTTMVAGPAAVESGSSSSSKHISRRQYSDKPSSTPSSPPVISSIPQECIVCNEQLPLIVFEPCQHQITCEECGIRMKKCLSCTMYIERRLTVTGKPLLLTPKDQPRQPSADRLRYLESKIMEIEETHCCSICMERRRNVAFLCGHGACSKCAETLKICHMCRKTITKKINLY